jgi:hypothetical protein
MQIQRVAEAHKPAPAQPLEQPAPHPEAETTVAQVVHLPMQAVEAAAGMAAVAAAMAAAITEPAAAVHQVLTLLISLISAAYAVL